MDLEKAAAEAAAGAAPANLEQARALSRAREALRERLDDQDVYEGLLACEAGLSAMDCAKGVRVDWSPGTRTFFSWSASLDEKWLEGGGAPESAGGSPCGERPLPLFKAARDLSQMQKSMAQRQALKIKAEKEAEAALGKLASVAEAFERRSSLSGQRIVELAKGAGLLEICEAFGVLEWGVRMEEARCRAACAEPSGAQQGPRL